MKRITVGLILAIMCLAPATLAETSYFETTALVFSFEEFSGPGESYTVVQRIVGAADSTIVATVPHVGDGRLYELDIDIDEANEWDVRVWGRDVHGRIGVCVTHVAFMPPFVPGGCSCRPRVQP